MKSLLEKLRKAQLSLETYHYLTEQLIKLKFDSNQIEKILSYKTAEQSVEVLKKYYQFFKTHFSHQQLTRIAHFQFSHLTLQSVYDKYADLLKLGFGKKQIVSIASHNCANSSILSVLNHFDTLQYLGFTHQEIVRLVNRIGGSKYVTAVVKNATSLYDLKFEPTDIIATLKNAKDRVILDKITQYYNIIKEYYSLESILAVLNVSDEGIVRSKAPIAALPILKILFSNRFEDSLSDLIIDDDYSSPSGIDNEESTLENTPTTNKRQRIERRGHAGNPYRFMAASSNDGQDIPATENVNHQSFKK